jgi:hypothetical protein
VRLEYEAAMLITGQQRFVKYVIFYNRLHSTAERLQESDVIVGVFARWPCQFYEFFKRAQEVTTQ